MNAHAARCENRALVNTWSRRVYRDGEFVGRVHPTDDQQWLAESADGQMLGSYPAERLAVVAILDVQRRSA